MSEITYVRHTYEYTVLFEGRQATIGTSQSPEAMRETAAAEEQRAAETMFRARRLRALADAVEAGQHTVEARRKAERNAKAAATRAHNADPFGFEALAERCGHS